MSRARGVYLFETVLVYLPAPLMILFFTVEPVVPALPWAAGAAVIVIAWRVLLFQRASAGDNADLHRTRLIGEVLAPLLQILWLLLLLPPGAAMVWAVVVVVVYCVVPPLPDPRRPYLSPAGLVLILLCAVLLVWPQLLPANSVPISACLIPGVTADPGMPCLPVESGADWMLLQVVLLVLFRPRRYFLSLIVWLCIGLVLAQFLPATDLPALLALTALPFFFPGRPYRLLAPRLVFALIWATGTGLLAYLVGPAGVFVHTAWLIGLLAAMLVSAGCEWFLAARRFS